MNKIYGENKERLHKGDLVRNTDNGKKFVLGGRFVAVFDYFSTGRDIVVPHIKLLVKMRSVPA